MICGILHVQFTCLTVFFHNLSTFSLVYVLAWHPQLHTRYISSPSHCLFCCSTEIMSSNPCLSLSCDSILWLNATHPFNHSHLCLLKCHLIFLSYRPGLTSMEHTTSHTTALYNLPVTISDISLLVSNSINCLNLFHPVRILVSTAASASPSALNMSP